MSGISLDISNNIVITASYASGSTVAIIPLGVTEIATNAFTNVRSIITDITFVTTTLRKLNNDTFLSCTVLTSVILPNTITYIGTSTFSGCVSLLNVTLPSNTSITEIKTTTFIGCKGLISMPVIPSFVTSIGINAFRNCSGLTSLNISSSNIKVIGNSTFKGCSGLTSLNLPSSIISIATNAFEGCSKIPSVIIPSSVTSIQANAFLNCSGLTSVVLDRYGALGYTTLGLDCFKNTTAINSTNFASLHTIYINGYTEQQLRSGPYQDYRDPSASIITYTGAGFDNGAIDYAITGSCFNEDTKILCFNPDSNEEYYVHIQNLNKGDLVKTYLHGYRKVDVLCKGKLRNNTKWFTTCMYKMRKTETNDLTEDLIVIGGHSLLVDKLSEEEYLRTCSIWGTPLKIDEKYLLLAGITDKFEIMEGNDVYTYYHFCVENDGNDETRYGVWANGVLVETPCKKDILEFKNVSYI